MNHGCEQFIFPGLGGATSTTVPASVQNTGSMRILVLITVTTNTWIDIGQNPTAAKNTGLLVNTNMALRVVLAPGDKVSYLADTTAGNISIVQISG